MVEMMIFSLKQGEIQAVYHTAKDLAARLTEEKWIFHCLETEKTAEEFVKSVPELDLYGYYCSRKYFHGSSFKKKKPKGLYDSYSKPPIISGCLYETQYYGGVAAFAAFE